MFFLGCFVRKQSTMLQNSEWTGGSSAQCHLRWLCNARGFRPKILKTILPAEISIALFRYVNSVKNVLSHEFGFFALLPPPIHGLPGERRPEMRCGERDLCHPAAWLRRALATAAHVRAPQCRGKSSTGSCCPSRKCSTRGGDTFNAAPPLQPLQGSSATWAGRVCRAAHRCTTGKLHFF